MASDALAEPGTSLSHLPFLWGLSVVFSALLSWITVKLITRSGYLKTPFKRWMFAFILFVIFMVFVIPVFVALGSIMITGRTM